MGLNTTQNQQKRLQAPGRIPDTQIVNPAKGGILYSSCETRRCSRKHCSNQPIITIGFLNTFNAHCNHQIKFGNTRLMYLSFPRA